MIRRIRHRGLKRLYNHDNGSGVDPGHAQRLSQILTLLDVAERPADMDLPGYVLHPLRGIRKGEWSVRVSGNWRVTFKFEGTNVADINYEDYH